MSGMAEARNFKFGVQINYGEYYNNVRIFLSRRFISEISAASERVCANFKLGSCVSLLMPRYTRLEPKTRHLTADGWRVTALALHGSSGQLVSRGLYLQYDIC